MSNFVNKLKNIESLSHVKGADMRTIREAEVVLNITFPKEYIELLSEFGAISFFGTEWNGLNIGRDFNVVKATVEARNLYPNFPNDKFILEDLHIDGILILSDSDGFIYEWVDGTLKKICNSLSEYLDECIERKLD